MKKKYLGLLFLVVLGISLISIFPSPANSQSDPSPGAIVPPPTGTAIVENPDEILSYKDLKIKCILKENPEDGSYQCYEKDEEITKRMGDTIHLEISNISRYLESHPDSKVQLFINGRIIPDNVGTDRNKDDVVEFDLKRTENSAREWNSILAGSKDKFKTIKIGAGLSEIERFKTDDGKKYVEIKKFNVFPFRKQYLIGMAIFTVLFIWLAATTEILRDSSPNLPVWAESKVQRQTLPYSLGRFQMGFWLVMIVGSFVLISLVTQSYTGIISAQSLVLLGISAATALSSVAICNAKVSQVEQKYKKLIENKKDLQEKILQEEENIYLLGKTHDDEADSEIAKKIAEAKKNKANHEIKLKIIKDKKDKLRKKLEPKGSEGFFTDVLNDIDGLSLHRFQMLIWTVILGAIFIKEVWLNLAMPEFDDNLLALQGISAATYLGFKFPETKNSPRSPDS